LQYGCNNVGAVEGEWSANMIDQGVSRVRRDGQTKPTFFTRFISTNTLDEGMLQDYYRKKSVMDKILNTGPEYLAQEKQRRRLMLENVLERIAVALEKIASGGVVLGANPTVENAMPPVDKPPAEKPSKAKDKPPAAETNGETKLDLEGLKAAGLACLKRLTESYKTLGSSDPGADARGRLSSVLAGYKAEKLSDVPKDKYGECAGKLNELEAEKVEADLMA